MPNRSRAQRSSKQKKAYLRRMAKETGKSVKDIQALEDALRQLPIERWLEKLFGPDHGAVYDASADLWIVPDPKHTGPGFGFIAIRRDRSWFRGVVPPEVFQ